MGWIHKNKNICNSFFVKIGFTKEVKKNCDSPNDIFLMKDCTKVQLCIS